jgi:hypothetical protein
MKKLTNVAPLLLIPLILSLALFFGRSVTAQAAGHGIKLTWTQSTTPSLTANTVYRSAVSGGPYTLVWTGSPTTSYNDPMTSTNQGTKACYVVTATATGMVESQNSNESCNTFPSQTSQVSGATTSQY